MEIVKINIRVRCDMGMCNKSAVYSIGNKDTMLRRKINLCEDCAMSMYKELSSLFVPKSPPNMIAKKRHRSR